MVSRRKWFEERKRVYLLDFQMPDSADQMPIGQPANLRAVDAADIVRRLHRAGVQALYVHAKDNQGNCYYDTQYGHKHSGIGGRDLMREFSTACREVDMTPLYYVQTSRERRGGLVASYAARNADGSPVVHVSAAPLLPARDEGPVICLLGPAREYVKNIVRELAQNYDFDGYWLDGYGWFGRTMICYCDTCRERYREDRGRELPPAVDKGDEGFRRYYHWRQTMNRRALHEIIATIRAVDPELTVTHNGSGFQVYADAFINDCDDYVSREFHYQEGYGGLALWCRMQDAFTPDRPLRDRELALLQHRCRRHRRPRRAHGARLPGQAGADAVSPRWRPSPPTAASCSTTTSAARTAHWISSRWTGCKGRSTRYGRASRGCPMPPPASSGCTTPTSCGPSAARTSPRSGTRGCMWRGWRACTRRCWNATCCTAW